jgi:hypothetical protein
VEFRLNVTRIVVSAENFSIVGLDEVWIDLMPVAE